MTRKGADAVLSRSPELMRRVCEGMTKYPKHNFLSAISALKKIVTKFFIIVVKLKKQFQEVFYERRRNH
jgi:flavoprotein